MRTVNSHTGTSWDDSATFPNPLQDDLGQYLKASAVAVGPSAKSILVATAAGASLNTTPFGVTGDASQPGVVPAPPALDAPASWSATGMEFAFPTLVSTTSSAAISCAGAAPSATSPTAVAHTTTGSAATPSWIASLNDAVIKADMTAASAGGSVSETGLAQLFTDLAAELTAGKTTLSAGQLTDLKLIAADLNIGETASSYVTYVTDALIVGNAANAKWTGGGASATTLGNLAVGSSATQVNELDGKWFLGTDLPGSTVTMNGASTFNVTYAAVTNPLFGANGPSMNDINQGTLGDCYLLASLAEVARQNPSLIQSMITNNGNNTYGVRFFFGGSAEDVTVNASLANGGTIFNRATDIWGSLVEKAYAQLQAGGVITGNSVNAGNSFSTIGNGGSPDYALEEITGASTITDFSASGTSWNQYVCNDTLAAQSFNHGLTTASVLATLVAGLAAGNDAVLCSRTSATDSSGKTTLVASHAMSIYGYDSTTGQLEIRNPWGTASGQSWDTTFEVSLTTLLADGDTISLATMTAAASSVVTGALASAAAGLQANAAVTSFTILDSAADVSAALAGLAADSKLSSITLTDAGTPTLALTAPQYGADSGLLAKIASKYALTVSGALASSAAGLQANAAVTSFTVLDSAADVSVALASLAADSKLSLITLTDAGTPTLALTAAQYAADAGILAKIGGKHALTVSGALASSAAGLQANAAVTSFTVLDSAADVSAALPSLAADTKLSSIALTGAGMPALTLTAAQYGAGASVLGKIAGKYALTVSGALASAAAGLQANAAVTSFTIQDSAADVSAALASLAADTKLSSIALTDAGTPTLVLTAAQYSADVSVLGRITGKYALTVSGALASAAAGYQANAVVTSFTVADSATNVASNIAALNGDTKLTSISLTDGKPLPITSAQLTGDPIALSKLPTTYTLSVSGVSASAATIAQANTHVASFAVSDTAANVTAALTPLKADTKLSALTVSGTASGDTLVLTGLKAAATINLNGDTASAGLAAPSLTFIGTPDAIALGASASIIDYTLQPASGIETIANFQYGLDQLDINLNGAANSVLQAHNTSYNGQKAIALASTADPTHGVVLTNVSSGMTAALLSNHLTFSGGHAIIT